MRISRSCDGCSRRRVKCHGGKPCDPCQTLSVTCTFSRVCKKRGPKGPRSGTAHKVEQYQQELQADGHQNSKHASNNKKLSKATGTQRPSCVHQVSLDAYQSMLNVFHERLYSVWPIVCHQDLLSRLQKDESDFESYALACALGAAVTVQLRLPEHIQVLESVTPEQFEAEAQRMRGCFEYREKYSLASLLTSFFLHVYFANTDRLRTAGFYLRETLTYAHGLRLHQTTTYHQVEPAKRQLMLRIYWILFVSERTYCVQNGLPVTLTDIDLFPNSDMMDKYESSLVPAFLSLVRLFICLEDQFLETTTQAPSLEALKKQSDRISVLQGQLHGELVSKELDESQRVDIFATRCWVRILLWQYTICRFKVSTHAHDNAFSMFLPVSVSYDMLSLFEKVARCSIEPHGYGMELKIFRVADSLIDVLTCTAKSEHIKVALWQSRTSLHALERVLIAVGGTKSTFVSTLRQRMSEMGLPVAHCLMTEQCQSSRCIARIVREVMQHKPRREIKSLA